jgi:hypothetical protein
MQKIKEAKWHLPNLHVFSPIQVMLKASYGPQGVTLEAFYNTTSNTLYQL